METLPSSTKPLRLASQCSAGIHRKETCLRPGGGKEGNIGSQGRFQPMPRPRTPGRVLCYPHHVLEFQRICKEQVAGAGGRESGNGARRRRYRQEEEEGVEEVTRQSAAPRNCAFPCFLSRHCRLRLRCGVIILHLSVKGLLCASPCWGLGTQPRVINPGSSLNPRGGGGVQSNRV